MAKRSGNNLSTTLIAADKGSSSGRHDRSCKLRSSSICTIVEEGMVYGLINLIHTIWQPIWQMANR